MFSYLGVRPTDVGTIDQSGDTPLSCSLLCSHSFILALKFGYHGRVIYISYTIATRILTLDLYLQKMNSNKRAKIFWKKHELLCLPSRYFHPVAKFTKIKQFQTPFQMAVQASSDWKRLEEFFVFPLTYHLYLGVINFIRVSTRLDLVEIKNCIAYEIIPILTRTSLVSLLAVCIGIPNRMFYWVHLVQHVYLRLFHVRHHSAWL